jgi:dolichol-phosphate mannosyltransferase
LTTLLEKANALVIGPGLGQSGWAKDLLLAAIDSGKLAVIDADMQHDESILGTMYQAVTSGEADVAIGSRYREGGSCGEWGARRVQLSRAATRLAQSVLPADISDPMSGFFVVRRQTVVDLAPSLSQKGFKILLDLLMSAEQPLRVREVPYVFRTREAGISKLSASVMLSCLTMLLKKAVRKWVPIRLVQFGAVGLLGLVVHLAVLRSLLFAGNLSFAAAQAVAVLTAIAFNFLLNNVTTYRDRRLRGLHMISGLLSFYAVCGVGALANIGVGSAIYGAGYRWWLDGAAGAVAGSVWNFALSSWFTWRQR